jgi:hypothetical protein
MILTPSILSSGYWGLFPRVVKLATQLHPVPRLECVELYLNSPISLDGVVLN